MGGYTHTSSEKSTAQQGGSNAVAAAPQPFTLGQRLGNQGLGRLLRSRRLQAKLTVSNPNDVYEQEADRVADQVMRMADPQHRPVSNTDVSLQRKCSSCEEELRRSPESPAVPTVDAATEQSISSLSGRGSPLSQSVRAFMEPRFNADFSAIRVHTDANAYSLARAVEAKAFTVGNNVVFGAGHFAPESDDGKRLLAHELAHTIQQRGAPPRIARSPDTENVLRLTSTGEIVTGERLIAWAMNDDRPVAHLIEELESSHRFSGSDEVRKRAAEALLKANEMFSLEELRAKQRAQAKANRLAGDESARRLRWLGGHGAISDGVNVLRRAGGPMLLPGGFVQFQEYDPEGVLIVTAYASVKNYRDSVREQLRKVGSRGEDLAHDVNVHVANDAKAVAETLEEAAIYQLPALLLFPGVKLGYSEEALEHGQTAGAYALRAHYEAHAALNDLESNREMRAGHRLNKASVLLLQARHALQAMLRTREADEEASLKHLEHYSTVGDFATIPMSPWLAAAAAIIKNAALRVAWMRSNPNVDFGSASFAWQSAITLASVWLQGRLMGTNPGFGRAIAVGVATNQATKVAVTGDMSQLLEFSRTDALFLLGGTAYSSAQARFGKPFIPYMSEPRAFTPVTGTPDPNATVASQAAAPASRPTYEERLLAWSQGTTQVVASNKPGFGIPPGQDSAAARGPRDYVKVTGLGNRDASDVPDTPHEDTVIEGFWRADDSTPKQQAGETRTVGAGYVGVPLASDTKGPPRKIGFKPDADDAPSATPEPLAGGIRHEGGNNWTIGEYTLLATRDLQGNVLHWRVLGVGRSNGGRSNLRAIKSLVANLLNDAAKSGANLLRITGAKLDTDFTHRLALSIKHHYKGTVDRVDGETVEIRVPVPQKSKTEPRTSVQVHRPKFGTPVRVTPGDRPFASAGDGRTGDSPEAVPESGSGPAAAEKASDAASGHVTSEVGHGQSGTALQRLGPRDVVKQAVAHARRAVYAVIPNGMGRPPDFSSAADMPGAASDRGPSQTFDETSLHLDPVSMAGACGYARQQVAHALSESGVPSEHIYVNQAAEISRLAGAQHAFVVYDSPDGIYLIDTTFAQFASPNNPHVEALLNTPDGARLRHDLLTDNYVLLTDKVADLYLRVISGTGETPVVGAADFMRPGANLAKNPGRHDIY